MMEEKGLHPAFLHNWYLFRKKVFKLAGAAFHVYDENGNLLFYSKQKAFKLREDFRVYSDESQRHELLIIKTPQILDIGAVYYVQDAVTGESVGALKRRGLKSFIKDEWTFLSPTGQQTGKLSETSLAGALLSRFINLVPQNYFLTSSEGAGVAEIKQHFNPFVLKYTMTIMETAPPIDRRLLVASGILLCGIEGRQR